MLKEIASLENLRRRLYSIDVFVEGVILRIETLIVADQVITSAITIKELVKELRKLLRNSIPIIEVYIDKLNSLSNDLINSIGIDSGGGDMIPVSIEAKKIIEEAKKVANIA